MSISLSAFRKDMSQFLMDLRMSKIPLFVGNRAKKEFVIFPVGDDSGEKLFETYIDIQDKLIQGEYYTGIEQQLSDRSEDIHDDLFAETVVV